MKEPYETIVDFCVKHDLPFNAAAAIYNAAVEACADMAYAAKTDKEAQHSILKLLIK